MYKPLLDACPFLYDCSSAAVTHFLTRLKVRVIDRNDVLMRSGSMRTIMYILQRGEIKIDFQPDEAKETIEHYVPGGRIGSNKSKFENRMSKGKDSMRGRTDKMGTMLGFHVRPCRDFARSPLPPPPPPPPPSSPPCREVRRSLETRRGGGSSPCSAWLPSTSPRTRLLSRLNPSSSSPPPHALPPLPLSPSPRPFSHQPFLIARGMYRTSLNTSRPSSTL